VTALGVLDIGGTHVTGAHISDDPWRLSRPPTRVDIDGHAPAAEILDGMASAARDSGPASAWAVAMPDPFDYDRGIGRFHGVGKFESLDGVDVRAGLAQRLGNDPADVHFCNDADAFTVGEWLVGSAQGAARVVGLTLGTGVGSGWIDRGTVVDPGMPPGGRAHRLFIDGAALEESMSRRAIRRAYADATGDSGADVREIADRARTGEPAARAVLAHAVRSLGRALAAPIHDFGADIVVVGGSMSGSWQLFEPWFREGAGELGVPPVRIAAHPDTAPLFGAAYVATTSR
jgi:glucokinase